MWDVSQRELKNLWNQVEKEKKKRVENERVGERKREGGSGIKWKVKKKKMETMESYGYTCVVDKMQEKKKMKKEEMYGWKKGKE